ATNRDLAAAVGRGTFRADLFYRLNVFGIPLAPLRERPDDILSLTTAFLQEIAQSLGRPPADLTTAARQALLQHEWPGNVRELRNALERATIVCESGLIEPDDLALFHAPPTSVQVLTSPPTTNLGVVERETIARILRETRWNKSEAAKRLGLS